MSAFPTWFAQLQWSRPWPVAALAVQRHQLPAAPGCYAFTDDDLGLRPDHVLYIGKAQVLRTRVGGYLVDYTKTAPTDHKGRAFIFAHRKLIGDRRMHVRWVEYGGNPAHLEANLCDFLWPAYTDRWETHELWNDDELIDPRLIW